MSRIIITGITGFVGSWLADYILENHSEVEVHGLKRWRSPMENIAHIKDRLTLHDGDLRDLSSMLTVIKEVEPDWVFHLASQSFVPYSYSVPTDTLITNVIGTAKLLEAVRISQQGRTQEDYWLDPKILICGSPEEYGQCETVMTEETPLNPVSPYAVSKVAETRLGYMYYKAYGLKTVISRAFAHEGPRRGEVFAVSVFAKQIAKIEKGIQEPVIKVGNLNSIRTYADVRDIVRAYWLLIEKGEPGEVYNIGGNETMTVGEMLKLMLSMTEIGDSVKTVVDEELLRPADVTLQIPDCSKFKKLTGWEPQIRFQQTLEDTLNYWRQRV